MFQTNTDLEESVLRISGCFFLRSSEQDPVFNGVADRSTLFIPFSGWTLFSARSFHVFFHVLIRFVIGSLRQRGI